MTAVTLEGDAPAEQSRRDLRSQSMLPAILWFAAGLTLGLIVVGFVALGSYERGLDYARRERFSAELANRRIVAVSRRAGGPRATEERATA